MVAHFSFFNIYSVPGKTNVIDGEIVAVLGYSLNYIIFTLLVGT